MGQLVRAEAIAGKTRFPDQPAIATPPSNPIFGTTPGAPIATFTTVQNFTFPAQLINTNAQVTVSPISLSTFPQTMQVPLNATALIVVSTHLAQNFAGFLFGAPYVAVFFGTGSSLTNLNVGTSGYTLQPGVTYTTPKIGVTLTAYYLAAAGAPVTVPLTIQATLYGRTP